MSRVVGAIDEECTTMAKKGQSIDVVVCVGGIVRVGFPYKP